MTRPIILDTGPLGMIAHPRPNKDIAAWFQQVLEAGNTVIIPEIADYELRRNLLVEELDESIRRLDELKKVLTYLPLTTQVMLRAAELWAFARKRGQLSADPKELNGDVILAAQAEQAEAIIATNNIGHLSLFVEAKNWKEIS